MIIPRFIKPAGHALQRARQWAATPTPCNTCSKVRKAAQRVLRNPKR